jgi:hypothetical protein
MHIIEHKISFNIKYEEAYLLKESVQELLKITKYKRDSKLDDKDCIPEFNIKIKKLNNLLIDLKNIIENMIDNGIEE